MTEREIHFATTTFNWDTTDL